VEEEDEEELEEELTRDEKRASGGTSFL